MKALKPSPAASPIVNRCIECGFCESNCPSKDVTLTPRQRITVYREMHRLANLPSPTDAEKQRCVRCACIIRGREQCRGALDSQAFEGREQYVMGSSKGGMRV